MEMRGKAISEQAYQEIVEAEKRTTDKRLSKKLSILLLRFGGKSIAETAEQNRDELTFELTKQLKLSMRP